MARAGDEVFNPVTGQRIRFLRTAADTDGELLEVETSYRAGAPHAPLHYHPRQEERFEVLAGKVRCAIGGHERTLEEGDVLEVPASTTHEFGGHPDSEGRVRWETRPALRTEEFMETTFRLAEDGRVSPRTGVPGLLQVALTAREYGEEFRLARPPWPLQRLLFAVLSPFARLRGLKPRYP